MSVVIKCNLCGEKSLHIHKIENSDDSSHTGTQKEASLERQKMQFLDINLDFSGRPQLPIQSVKRAILSTKRHSILSCNGATKLIKRNFLKSVNLIMTVR